MSGLTDTQVDAVASAATSLVAALRAVVDTEAHGEPSPPRSGTSSAGGIGQRPPAAPSTETRQAAQDGQSGSGGDAMDGVPAHQPTPQAGDVWERVSDGRRLVVVNKCDRADKCWRVHFEGCPDHWHHGNLLDSGRLVERDGKPWPPAQEPEPVAAREGLPWAEIFTDMFAVMQDVVRVAHADGPAAAVERLIDSMVARDIEVPEPVQEPEPEPVAGVEPATGAEIAALEEGLPRYCMIPATRATVAGVIARLRQEQARGENAESFIEMLKGQRSEAQRERDAAVARANRAEAALARVERDEARPRKGEVWEKGGLRVRLHRKAGSPTNTRGDWLWVATIVELMPELDGPWAVGETITVELDRGGWFRESPAQEPEPVAGVEPATDEEIAAYASAMAWRVEDWEYARDGLIARLRQEQTKTAEKASGRGEALIERDVARRERDEAVARAEKAEAALARVERVTDLERAVVEAALAACGPSGDFYTGWRKRSAVADAVRGLRDAQEAGS